jgi:hypothetical protein
VLSGTGTVKVPGHCIKCAAHVVVSGKPTKADLEACWELAATVAAHLMQ